MFYCEKETALSPFMVYFAERDQQSTKFSRFVYLFVSYNLSLGYLINLKLVGFSITRIIFARFCLPGEYKLVSWTGCAKLLVWSAIHDLK